MKQAKTRLFNKISLVLLLFWITIATSFADCQTHHLVIEPTLSYEQWQMPNKMKPMGILGLHGRVHLTSWFYGGMGLDSAISGEKGGYFGLALEGGVRYPLFSALFLDGGIRVGGGGGHSTPVGGGLFYEPYAGIQYAFQKISTEIYYSYVNFVDGKIVSHQMGLAVSFPFDFDYVTTTQEPSSSCDTAFCTLAQHSKNYIAGLIRAYFPNKNARKTNGNSMRSEIGFLGIEFAHYLKQSLFVFFNFSGALHGNENGYADELLGLGYQFPLGNTSKWSGIIKLAAGSGGGGSVDTGGGFIYSPILGIEYRITPAFAVEFNGGYIDAPGGHFSAKIAGLLLKYYFPNEESPHWQAWQIRLFNQTYLKPRAESGEINPAMQLLGFNVDYFMTHYFYVTGQTAFAYIGRDTGGYFSGMLGIGGETPIISKTKFNLFSEILAGTAGGAGLSIGEGALIEPVAGLQYQLDDALGLQAALGYLVAMKGQFRSPTISAGISYKLWK